MNITYHLLDVEWRRVINLKKYEPYIQHVAKRFPMISRLTVTEKHFTMHLNVTDPRAKNGVVRAFFTQLAQTPLNKFGDFKYGTFKVFIEKKHA